MSLALRVVDAAGAEVSDTYLIRLGGWTEERYFAEAPEDRIVEFEEGERSWPRPPPPPTSGWCAS